MRPAVLARAVAPPRNPRRRAALVGGAGAAILAILYVFAVRPWLHRADAAKRARALVEARRIRIEAMPEWERTHGHSCPDDPRELAALIGRHDLRDPWDQVYAIHCRSGYALVTSAGPDLLFGTDDDVGDPFVRVDRVSSCATAGAR